MELFPIICIGAFIGVTSTLVGLGGNILIVPLLPLVMELKLNSVVATGIFSVFFITLVNTIRFYRNSLIDFELAKLLIPFTFLGSFLSSYNSSCFSEFFVQTLFLVVMVFMILRLNLNLNNYLLNVTKHKQLLILASLSSGFIAGISGIGSGVILGPLLIGFNVTDHRKVSPTINLLIMIACFSATLNNIGGSFVWPMWGSVRIDVALILIIPALLSSVIGRRLNNSISLKLRKRVITTVLLILILKVLASLTFSF